MRRQRFRGQTTPVTSKQGSPEATITKQHVHAGGRGGGWPPRIPPPPPSITPHKQRGTRSWAASLSLFLSLSLAFSLFLSLCLSPSQGGMKKCLFVSLHPSLPISLVISHSLSFSHFLSLSPTYHHYHSLSNTSSPFLFLTVSVPVKAGVTVVRRCGRLIQRVGEVHG